MFNNNHQYQVDTIELRKAMVEMSLTTLSVLAEKSKVDRNTLGKVVSGKILPSSKVMYALVDTLHIDPSRAGRIFFAKDLPNT